MKRVGLYDAFDKWEILCRYWEDRDSAAGIGADKVDRPLVPKWQRLATACGLRVGIDYLSARLDSPRLPPGFVGNTQPPEASVAAEIARLAVQFDPAWLKSRYRLLVEAITTRGFQTSFDSGLSPDLAERLRQVFKQSAIEALQWTEDDGELPTVPVLRYWAPQFPIEALQQKSNVLCIFCGRFYGRADVIHVHDAGPDTVTLVDNDALLMTDMKSIYPSHWHYVTADYKQFLADAAQSGMSYDFIVADPWLTMAREVAWDFLFKIMNICSDTFITNYSDEMFSELNLRPDDLAGLSRAVNERSGTKVTFTQVIPRAKPAYWAVMRKVARDAGERTIDMSSPLPEQDEPILRDGRLARGVVVIGPSKWWREVSPQGSLHVEDEAPVLIHPQQAATTGPSPRLRCGFFRPDGGEPVDIIIQIAGAEGLTNFRLKLGPLREVDLRELGIALPAGKAEVWAVHQRSPDAPWATYRRVDFHIHPDADNEPELPSIHPITVDPAELAKCPPSELSAYFATFSDLEKRGYISRRGRPVFAQACVDLDKYKLIDDFIHHCRKVHKGNAVRAALRATKLGYYSKFFNFRSYVPDIVAISRSAPVRGGRPMTHYERTVADYGGYPQRIDPEHIPDQAAVWVRYFGVFRRTPGHRQGDVVSDEQLLAYISLRRCGDYALYSVILGHADHLADGIMYKMHLDLVSLALKARDRLFDEADASLRSLRGIRYLMYSAYYQRPGLLLWRKRMLFEPLYMKFDYLAECSVDQLCAAAQYDPENMESQALYARMLTETIQRCLDKDRPGDAAVARAGLVAVSKRLAAPAIQASGADRGTAWRDDDLGQVVVIGPTPHWSEVSPEGPLHVADDAPTLIYPPNGTTTGPSPLLRCEFPATDNSEPVDIVIEVSGDEGVAHFRLKLGRLRHADLGKLGIALPPGKAKAWAVCRRPPDSRWATARRVDFRVDPHAAETTDTAPAAAFARVPTP